MPGQLPQIEDSVTLTRIWYSPQAALVRTCGTCVFCDCLRSRGQTCPSRPKLSQVAHSGLEEGVGQGDHKGRKLCEHPRVTKCVTPGSRDRVGGRCGEWPGRRLMEDGNSPESAFQKYQSRPSRLWESCSALLCCSLRSNFVHRLELQLEVGNPESWSWKGDCGLGHVDLWL